MVVTVTKRGFGWRPDKPDHRDLHYTAKPVVSLPDSVDLRPGMPPVEDQGNLGACTAFACGGCYDYLELKQNKETFQSSKLFLYYEERRREKTTSYDAGAENRDGFKVLHGSGVCSTTDWPYDIAKFAMKPSMQAYQDAKLDRSVQYMRVPQNITTMQTALYNQDAIVVGFSVYSSFMSDTVASTGIVPMPGTDEQLLGGHAVLVVGYDNTRQCWVARNSWSETWGDKGYFYMPYEYLLNPNLSSDFWTLQKVM